MCYTGAPMTRQKTNRHAQFIASLGIGIGIIIFTVSGIQVNSKVQTQPKQDSTLSTITTHEIATKTTAQVPPVSTIAETVQVIPQAHAEKDSTSDTPVSLSIPSIHLTTDIIPVGLTAGGNMDVPNNFVQAGWYKYGAIPGQTGSAVIDGHVDNGAAISGVFKHLRTLATGDDIAVTSAAGNTLHFKVTEMNVYPYTSLPMANIVSREGSPRLTIITCHGTFIPSEKTYDQRLVVIAVLQ